MKFHDRFIRRQLELMKPIADNSSLELTRSFQDKIGRLMQFTRRKDIVVSEQRYSDIPGALIIPREEVSSGIILYLHGGGYVCGSLEYARGVASILSSECGMRVFSLEYLIYNRIPLARRRVDRNNISNKRRDPLVSENALGAALY